MHHSPLLNHAFLGCVDKIERIVPGKLVTSSFMVVQYMTECRFNWRMMKTIFTELHVYDEDKTYVPFDFKKEEPFLQFQRKVLPNMYRQPSV